MSSGAALASVSAYNALPSQAGGASGPTATSFISPNLAAGYGTNGGINGQQNGTAAALNPDSVSSNQSPDQYRSLMHQEMIAPAPPAGVSAADSAQIFKIGNSGLVAITIAGVVIGVASFVGVQAIFEALGQRHKHEAHRVQVQQNDKNAALDDGKELHDRSNAIFEQSASEHENAVVTDISTLSKGRDDKAVRLQKSLQLIKSNPENLRKLLGSEDTTEFHAIRSAVAKQLAQRTSKSHAHARLVNQHAALFDSATLATYATKRAELGVTEAKQHTAFLENAVHPIIRKLAVR